MSLFSGSVAVVLAEQSSKDYCSWRGGKGKNRHAAEMRFSNFEGWL